MPLSGPIAVAVILLALAPLSGCRRAAEREPEAEPPVPVFAERVRLGSIRGTVSATGVVTTLPGATYAVFAPQPARITDITKNAGDTVTSGETLVRFEFPSLRAQIAVNAASVRAAELRAQQARLVQSRIKALVAQGAASRNEMEDANRELVAAEAELNAARTAVAATQALGEHTIARAPFDGIVAERLHNPGDNARATEDDPILRLVDPKQVQVAATVSAADATRFAIGASARAVAEGAPVGVDAATPRSVAAPEPLRVVSRPVPEAGARTVEVALAFDTPTTLEPGTQVAVEIDAEQRSNVPLVPAIAVLNDDPAQPVVVVAEGNVARRRPVAIGLVDAENIEILSGLKSGELIITQGHSALRDGTPISVSAP